MRTFNTFSIGSPRFTFKIRCASSRVIRCSRVKRSVSEPDVALFTPPTSELRAAGVDFASEDTNQYKYTLMSYAGDALLTACLPAAMKALPKMADPEIRICTIALGED